ncbi:MAG TPA: hypothetical protein VG898_03315 [Solirubrobacterales bacterium]|nr:hypothetical protein [Solirubrobacterales bacterium]
MLQGLGRGSSWLKPGSLVLFFATAGLFVFSLCGLDVGVTQADGPAVPIYNGDMAFPTIHEAADPEEFSWQVVLGEGQELEAVDDRHLEIYYTEGHHPALGIAAESAHDADGSEVPTTLSLSGDNVITLTVHHRAGDPSKGGASFDYPVMVGKGWEGGFQTVVVTTPPAEKDPDGQAGTQSPSRVKVRKRRGRVGGRPTIPLGPPDEGKRTTPDFVIGKGRTAAGPVELVAYGWLAPRDSLPIAPRRQVCVWVEHLPREISPGFCGPLLAPDGGRKIVIDDRVQALGKPAQRSTEIGGRLTPDVDSVRVSYRRNGRKLSEMAVMARVDGDLQRKLHQPTSFGYFDLRVRGQVPWGSMQVQAYDRKGALLATAGEGASSQSVNRGSSESISSAVPSKS